MMSETLVFNLSLMNSPLDRAWETKEGALV